MKTIPLPYVAIGVACLTIFGIYYFTQHGDMGILSGNTGFFLIAGTLGVVAYRAQKRAPERKRPEKRRSEHGSAYWANSNELAKAGVTKKDLNNPDDGTTWFNKDFCLADHYHALTIGPSRSGKGASVILPNLLTKPNCSYVLTDPKGELACITAYWQEQCGQKVYIIDPWDLQTANEAGHSIKQSGFNPFDFIKHDKSKIIDNCHQIAELLVPPNPQAKDPFWDDSARNLIKLCMMHIVTAMPRSDHNFWTLYKMLRPVGEEWIDMLTEMQSSDAFGGLVARMSAEYVMSPSDNPLRSTLSTAQNATTIFESEELRASLLRSDFNPLDLSNGNCTVYIVIPYEYLQSHARWLRMVVGMCIKAATVKVNQKVKFILDEFGVLGKMDAIANGFQFLAGKNICLWPFVQDLGTLKSLYGEEGMNKFIANASVLQFFNARDGFTAKYLSDLLGKQTMEQESKSSSYNPMNNTYNSSTSTSLYGRELMTPEEISKDDRTIILYSGLKAILPKHYYFNIPVFKERAGSVPM